jgi:hypothetical protein
VSGEVCSVLTALTRSHVGSSGVGSEIGPEGSCDPPVQNSNREYIEEITLKTQFDLQPSR